MRGLPCLFQVTCECAIAPRLIGEVLPNAGVPVVFGVTFVELRHRACGLRGTREVVVGQQDERHVRRITEDRPGVPSSENSGQGWVEGSRL